MLYLINIVPQLNPASIDLLGQGDGKSKRRSLEVESSDPDAFYLYRHWLRRRTFPTRVNAPGVEGNEEYLRLAKAYVLGEQMGDINFKDAVIDAIVDKSNTATTDKKRWSPVGPVIRCIYDNTPETSPARQLLVDLYAVSGRSKWLHTWAKKSDLTKDFLYDLSIALFKQKQDPTGKRDKPTYGTCVYHQHPPGLEFCYKNQSLKRTCQCDAETLRVEEEQKTEEEKKEDNGQKTPTESSRNSVLLEWDT